MASYYTGGTITVAAGATSATGASTAWLSGAKEGDLLVAWDGSAFGAQVLAADPASNTALTLAGAWRGPALTTQATYLILHTGSGWGEVATLVEQVAELIAAVEAGASAITNDSSVSGATIAAALNTLLALASTNRRRQSVRVATTASVNLANALEAGDAIGGVTLATGDWVLVKDQSTASQNGVYVVPASGAASRADGFNAWDDHVAVIISVAEGAVGADTIWLGTANKGGTLGSTSITFTQLLSGDFTLPAAAILTLPNTGLHLLDTDASHDLIIKPGSNLTADRILTINTGDAARALTLAGDVSVSVYGATVVDDADAATARTTLGLGTMATQAASAVAITGGTAMFSGAVGIDIAGTNRFFLWKTSGLTRWGLGANSSSETGSNAGSDLQINRYDDAGVSIGGVLQLKRDAGYITFFGGLIGTGATGGDKGAGTVNAKAVYDDNVILTDVVEEFVASGNIDVGKWDATVPDTVVPARVVREERLEAVEIPTREYLRAPEGFLYLRKGTRTELRPVGELEPVYSEDGRTGIDAVFVPEVVDRAVPETRIVREHDMVRRFKALVDTGFDPRDPAQYAAKLKAGRALPGNITTEEWEHNKLSTGELHNHLTLATEILASAFVGLTEKVAELEARLTALRG